MTEQDIIKLFELDFWINLDPCPLEYASRAASPDSLREVLIRKKVEFTKLRDSVTVEFRNAVLQSLPHTLNDIKRWWRGGTRPQIEDFVAHQVEPVRSGLLRALVQKELEIASWIPPAEDYKKRFPNDTDVIGEVYSDHALPHDWRHLRIGEVVKEGGQGMIFRARDTFLGRGVALKTPKTMKTPSAASGGTSRWDWRNRVANEARITGQLEHPGIVPVYSLGTRPDPSFSMMFINGIGLDDAIKAAHAELAATLSRPSGQVPPARLRDRILREYWEIATTPDIGGIRLEDSLRALKDKRASLNWRDIRQRPARLLRCFNRVCHTIAYAHGKGFIHRDVKPKNIMVSTYFKAEEYVDSTRHDGAIIDYGETYLLDWGLAEEIGRQGEDDKDYILAGRSPSGQVQGYTPGYASPEQARGEPCDERSDIFSLGATLYHILTGEAPEPFGDAQPGEHTDPVKDENEGRRSECLSPAQHSTRTVPRALDRICRKATAARPEDRYASAMQLAIDLQLWLADEKVPGVEEHPIDQIARLARRHRLLATVILGGGVLGTVCLALMLTLSAAELGRQKEENRSNALAQQVIDPLIRDLDAELRELPGNTEAANILSRRANEYYDLVINDDSPHRIRARAEALGRKARVLAAAEGDVPGAIDCYLRSFSLYTGRLWGPEDRREVASIAVAAGRLHRQNIIDQEVLRRLYTPDTGNILTRSAPDGTDAVPSHLRHARFWYDQASEILGDDQVSGCPDLREVRALLSFARGDLELYGHGNPASAVPHFQNAIDCLKDLLLKFDGGPASTLGPEGRQTHRELAMVHGFMGDAYLSLGPEFMKASHDHYRESLRLRQRVLDDRPDSPVSQQDLGRAYTNLGNWHEFDSLTAAPQARIDALGRAAGQHVQALEIQRNLVGRNPSVPVYHADLATSCQLLGTVYLRLGRQDEARDRLVEARDQFVKLLERGNHSLLVQRGLARTGRGLAVLAYLGAWEGDVAGALQQSRELLEVIAGTADGSARPEDLLEHAFVRSLLAIEAGLAGSEEEQRSGAEDSTDDHVAAAIALIAETRRKQLPVARLDQFRDEVQRLQNAMTLTEALNGQVEQIIASVGVEP